MTSAVIGTVVNLRTGPGTDHPTDGEVRAGDRLQVMHPVATGEHI